MALESHDPCSGCGAVVAAMPVGNERNGPIDGLGTLRNVIHAVDAGGMAVLRGDCPLNEMEALVLAETKYTVVQYLHCNRCGNTIFFGLCLRGRPIYKVVPADDVDAWPWEHSEPVAPRPLSLRVAEVLRRAFRR